MPQMHGIFYITVILMLHQVWWSSAKVRWCADGKTDGRIHNLTQYDDKRTACMKCSTEEKLIPLSELNQRQCCKGEVTIGACADEDLLHACTLSAKCDNKKQCYNGSDEMGCFNCKENEFSCYSEAEGKQCMSLTKVCDSVKDCIDGKDETLCPYYGGWCDGFLCGDQLRKCIDYDKVCDGTKDCLDGSDEIACQYCTNQFRCGTYFHEGNGTSSADCVGKFRVCNGEIDCKNGTDELNCFHWQEWSNWSECGTETESCTRIRRRSCVEAKDIVVSSSLCTKDANDINENQVDICPACLAVGNLTSVTTDPVELVSTEQPMNVTRPLDKAPQRMSLDVGALAGIVVASSLAVIGFIVAGGILALNKLGRTGFWRPSTKLPGPTSSSVPGVGNISGNRVAPNRVMNPYANDEENERVTGGASSS